jgi:hypothetical protein
MRKAMGRFIAIMLFTATGCAVAPDEPAPDQTEAVEQDVTSCQTACKIAELTCLQHCPQDGNGCGCFDDYRACLGGC